MAAVVMTDSSQTTNGQQPQQQRSPAVSLANGHYSVVVAASSANGDAGHVKDPCHFTPAMSVADMPSTSSSSARDTQRSGVKWLTTDSVAGPSGNATGDDTAVVNRSASSSSSLSPFDLSLSVSPSQLTKEEKDPPVVVSKDDKNNTRLASSLDTETAVLSDSASSSSTPVNSSSVTPVDSETVTPTNSRSATPVTVLPDASAKCARIFKPQEDNKASPVDKRRAMLLDIDRMESLSNSDTPLNGQGGLNTSSERMMQDGSSVKTSGSLSNTGSSSSGSSSPLYSRKQTVTSQVDTPAGVKTTGAVRHSSPLSSLCYSTMRSPTEADGLTPDELEAVEACQWLRAAGFPQYPQMFEDGLFPVELSDVQRDHDFLDGDSIQSVIRRLNILNTCAVMKIDAQPCKKATEESDEEDLCALSDRWEYQKTVRRWSRKGPDMTLAVAEDDLQINLQTDLQPSSSKDSLLGEDSGSHTDDSPLLDSKMPHSASPESRVPDSNSSNGSISLGGHPHQPNLVPPPEPLVEGLMQPQDAQVSSFPISPKLRRAASERLKSALRKMESFKKKSKKYPANRHIVEISDPVVADQQEMQAKLQHLNCVDISPNGLAPSPATAKRPSPPPAESTPVSKTAHGIGSVSAEPALSPVLPIAAASPIVPAPPSLAEQSTDSSASSQADNASLSEYYSAHSQLLANLQACSQGGRSPPGTNVRKNSDSSLVEIFLLPQDHKPGSFPRLLKNGYIDTAAPFQPSGPSPQASPVLPPQSPQKLHVNAAYKSPTSRVSIYDNFPPSSPQHQQHSVSGGKNVEDRFRNGGSFARPSQVVRSFSVSSTTSGSKSDVDISSEAAGMVRSHSASAATSSSLEQQASSSDNVSVQSELVGSTFRSSRKSSVVMEEFDTILQNLYKDISNLSRSIGQDSYGDDDKLSVSASSHTKTMASREVSFNQSVGRGRDVSASCQKNKDVDVYATCQKNVVPNREVSFSLAEQNGHGERNIGHSTSGGKLRLETQLSQRSVSETDSVQLGPVSPGGGDDSMEGEEGELCTTSSQDSSDMEGSADDTLERIAMGARERRDSGVGSSLTRASSERKRKKIRWESFQKCHRPSRASRELQIGGLSVCQLLPLQKLSLLKLTSIMEKCSPTNRSQWSWSVPRFMKRHKAPQFSDKNVFGVPFTVMLQRTGQPLPQCVLYAMRYLRKTSYDAIGIFRKSGVRSRIQKLRDLVESTPDGINFDELQPYDVADLLKQYFRELPECLLTNKLSDTFRSIFTHVPQPQRLEALQTAIILLPEENREVLHCLLLFLGDIAQHADKHQMNASNLAVCFAPSLFNFLGSHGTNSPRRQRKSPGVPEQRELLEQKAVHECFTYMITECKKLFMVPPSMYSRLHLSTLSNMEPVHLDEFYAMNKQPGPDFKAFGEEHIQVLLKEVHDKNRGWVPTSIGVSGIEVMQRKPQDGHPLRQWKCSVEMEAPPIEVLTRILHERHKWDDDMLSWDVVERLDRHSDVFHYVLNSMAPHPPRHFMVIRYWRPDLVKGACALVSKSVEHSGSLASAAEYDQGVRAVDLGSSYLIEPCGSGRSRLTYIARADLRGRCPEWYNRIFGHMCANFVDRLQDSFRQEAADGPETKV